MADMFAEIFDCCIVSEVNSLQRVYHGLIRLPHHFLQIAQQEIALFPALVLERIARSHIKSINIKKIRTKPVSMIDTGFANNFI